MKSQLGENFWIFQNQDGDQNLLITEEDEAYEEIKSAVESGTEPSDIQLLEFTPPRVEEEEVTVDFSIVPWSTIAGKIIGSE